MHIIDGTVGECWTEDERVPELQMQSKITRKFQLKLESNKKSCFQPSALSPHPFCSELQGWGRDN